MRPPGEIRARLRDCWPEMGAGASWREVVPLAGLSARSPADCELVRRTVVNMAAAGELEPCGRHKPDGERVWLTLYSRAAPAPPPAVQADSFDDLLRVLRSWVAPGGGAP